MSEDLRYKAFDGIAIEVYENGDLITTHYVPTFAEAHYYAKKIENTKGIELRFYTCDEWGKLIDRM